MRTLLASCVALSLLAPVQQRMIAGGGPQDLREAAGIFAPLFFPKVIQDTYRLKEYVCSEEFAALRSAQGDLAAVDAIFERALSLSWGNRGEALFLAMVATLDHRRVDFTLPLIGFVLPVPLTGEFEEEFRERLQALPARLYTDSPRTQHGDRDKLQHFFGSAFLVLLTESEGGADEIGYLVERGESRYVPGESIDLRDVRANRQGQRFGRALLDGEEQRPSAFLRLPEAGP